MNITNDIKSILDKGKEKILNKHIPETSNQITSKLMDVYELGIELGMEIENIRYNNILINEICDWIDEYFQKNNIGSPYTKMSMISDLKNKFKKTTK